MHYPWWYIPFLTSPMLIAIVSTLHILVSHYAVGGGFFLAVETAYAYRTGNRSYLNYLEQHAWFFILITVVYGAITGVGIWWTIGLASPLATEMLIHTFVFGWGMEYVAFIIEITAAFLFFYYWGKVNSKTHVTYGWIYAIAAWVSLLLITGITAFMLNPGAWLNNRSFWIGFFNPQLIPQVLARTGGSFLLASLYVYLHAAFKIKDDALHDLISTRSARPALLGAIFVAVGGVLWFIFLPASAKDALIAASALSILMMLIFMLTIAVFVMIYLGPFKHPNWFSPGFAILFFACGIAAISTGEFVREAVRKPYIVYNTVLGNQIFPEEIPHHRQAGYLQSGVWTRALMAEKYPSIMQGDSVVASRLPLLPDRDQMKIGEVLFLYHCNDCHAIQGGYSAVKALTRGWDYQMIHAVVQHPEKAHFFMPPWSGTEEETVVLSKYLVSIAPAHPPGMNYGER